MKNVAILGSTGSIGTQTLNVIEKHKDKFKVVSLVANTNLNLLLEQSNKFNPNYLGLIDTSVNCTNTNCKVEQGECCLINALADADIVVVATTGITALKAVEYAITKGIAIGLANKEVMVSGGEIISRLLKQFNTPLYPIDSEHSAIWQCLQGKKAKRLILTASGGPFFNYSMEQLNSVTIEQALRHPKWKMGKKITIDSATLMNKGLEVIEAKWLFDMNEKDIDVIVHQQSVIHSMVEFEDNSVIAQMSNTDMQLPIQYALMEGNHCSGLTKQINFAELGSLTFSAVDDKLNSIKMCRNALNQGGFATTILNAANEVVVGSFLANKISFVKITRNVELICEKFNCSVKNYTIDNIIKVDDECRKFATMLMERDD